MHSTLYSLFEIQLSCLSSFILTLTMHIDARPHSNCNEISSRIVKFNDKNYYWQWRSTPNFEWKNEKETKWSKQSNFIRASTQTRFSFEHVQKWLNWNLHIKELYAIYVSRYEPQNLPISIQIGMCSILFYVRKIYL